MRRLRLKHSNVLRRLRAKFTRFLVCGHTKNKKNASY